MTTNNKQKMVTMSKGFGIKQTKRVLVMPGHVLYTAPVKATLEFDGGNWYVEYRTFAKHVEADILSHAEVL